MEAGIEAMISRLHDSHLLRTKQGETSDARGRRQRAIESSAGAATSPAAFEPGSGRVKPCTVESRIAELPLIRSLAIGPGGRSCMHAAAAVVLERELDERAGNSVESKNRPSRA